MRILTVLISLLCLFATSAQAQNSEQQQFEKDAQLAIKALAADMKKALMSAMQDGGPVEAVSVCKLIAPSLAAEISKQYGLDIRRTSLKIRNPDNEADSWETDVLQRFETRLASGEAIQKLSFSEKVENDKGPAQWRMMKAIPTDKVCLSCHGSKIVPPVQAMLDQHYPDDMATGFKLGDIRGAFTVKRDVREE
jgi:type II secretory pathway pseudopilin PulG